MIDAMQARINFHAANVGNEDWLSHVELMIETLSNQGNVSYIDLSDLGDGEVDFAHFRSMAILKGFTTQYIQKGILRISW